MNRFLKKILLKLYPKPLGIGTCGRGSIVMIPRKIQGASSIHIHENTIIGRRSWIGAFQKYGDQYFEPIIKIMADVRIGSGFILTAVDSIVIENGCLISESVFISDHSHGTTPGVEPPTTQPLASKGPVKVGRHCFLGIRSVIMPGVTLGDYCVVGANSVVTHSFPAGSVIAGAPAKLVRTLSLK